MNRDKALLKIKKCMALGRSGEPHEAAAALRQAQKLMEQFNLSEKEVELADVKEVRMNTALQSGPRWEVSLANLIANAFSCRVIWTHEARLIGARVGLRSVVAFIGVGAAADVAGYAWSVLDRKCAAQRLAHLRTQPKSCKPSTLTARGDAFADGWVMGIRVMLREFAGQEPSPLIAQFVAQRYGTPESKQVQSRAVGRNVKGGSLMAGIEAGARERLDKGLSTHAPARLANHGKGMAA